MFSEFPCCGCVWRQLAQPMALAELPFSICSTAQAVNTHRGPHPDLPSTGVVQEGQSRANGTRH